MKNAFSDKTGYGGDLKELLKKVCIDYNLGNYVSNIVIPEGYEDFNVILESSSGKYLIKILSRIRTPETRQRYLNIMTAVGKSGLSHPNLYGAGGGYLHKITMGNTEVYLFVLEYINGKSLYSSKYKPNSEEIKFLCKFSQGV